MSNSYGIPLVEMIATFPDGRKVVERGQVVDARPELRRIKMAVVPCEGHSTRCWIKNRELENQNVHPFVELRTSGWVNLRKLYDAKDQKIPSDIFVAEVFGRPFYFGLRDSALLGVDSIVDEAGGTVSWKVYDTQHIRSFQGVWGQDGGAGDDPVSDVRPTLPGGCMVTWTLGAGFYPGAVDAPPVADWRSVKARLEIPSWKELPPRVKAMIRNWTEVEVQDEPDGVPLFRDVQRDSFIFWAISGDSRFKTWDADPEGDIFEKRIGGFDSHPLVWGSLVNSDGATANHYNAGHGALMAWVWINEAVEAGEIQDAGGHQRNLAWWLASKWLYYSATTAKCWSEGDPWFGNDWYEKSLNGSEAVYLGETPSSRSAEFKSWARNTIAAHVALPADAEVQAGLDAYRAYLLGDTKPWAGRWSERGPARRIMNLIEVGSYLGDQKVLQRVASRVDEMIKFSDAAGRNFEMDRTPPGATNVFISAKAGIAVAFALSRGLATNPDQRQRWVDWLAKRAGWLAKDGVVFLPVEGGGERATCNYFITPQKIPAAYNRGTMCCNVPAHSMTAIYPDNLFTDSWAALLFGSALAICGDAFPGADLVERAWRGTWGFLGEGFDYLGQEIGEVKSLVQGQTEFPARVIDAKDGRLVSTYAAELKRNNPDRRANHFQFGNWNNKKETFGLLEVLPGCVAAARALGDSFGSQS